MIWTGPVLHLPGTARGNQYDKFSHQTNPTAAAKMRILQTNFSPHTRDDSSAWMTADASIRLGWLHWWVHIHLIRVDSRWQHHANGLLLHKYAMRGQSTLQVTTMIIAAGLTSNSTDYRDNQTALNLNRLTSPCYNNTTCMHKKIQAIANESNTQKYT